MQFQWCQSRAVAEKFHSGIVPHAGEYTRVFEDAIALSRELGTLGDVVGSRLTARVAMVFDWNNRWAREKQGTPAQLSYVANVFRWY